MLKSSAKRLRPALYLPLFLLLLAPVATINARAQEPAGQQAPASAGEQTTPLHNVPEKKAEAEDENEAFRKSPTVQKLGRVFGMNPEQAATAFTVFNFVVLVILVGYGLLKAMPKAFRSRNTAIQKQLVDARTATEEAKARLSSVEARLSKLDEQIDGMRAQSEADAIRDEQRIRAAAEDEKAKILAAAEAEIQAATITAQRQIQQYAAELAIEQAARKLIVTAETDRLLVESFAHRLTSDKGGQN